MGKSYKKWLDNKSPINSRLIPDRTRRRHRRKVLTAGLVPQIQEPDTEVLGRNQNNASLNDEEGSEAELSNNDVDVEGDGSCMEEVTTSPSLLSSFELWVKLNNPQQNNRIPKGRTEQEKYDILQQLHGIKTLIIDSKEELIGGGDPIYLNSEITVNECVLLIFALRESFSLSKAFLAELLKLLDIILPQGHKVPTTPYLMEKILAPDLDNTKKTVYCPQCGEILEEGSQQCGSCSAIETYKANLTRGNFFVNFNLSDAILHVIKRKDVQLSLCKKFQERLLQRPGVYRDVSDGEIYRLLELDPFDISCSINSDGLRIFKSSKYHFWPLILQLNEISHGLRRKHMILAGMWFGEGKPNFNAFLEQFVEEANALTTEGVSWRFGGVPTKSKIVFPLLAADSPARNDVIGINQHTGSLSCPGCFANGETFKITPDGKRRKWVFDPDKQATLRNASLHISQLDEWQKKLTKNEKIPTFHGIKFASTLIHLRGFKIIDSFVFDYMHTVLLGVVQMLLFCWIESKNHTQPYYIGTRQEQINQNIALFKVLITREVLEGQ